MDRLPVDIAGASLPFFQYRRGDATFIEFDSTGCSCPIPMVNAMAGLQYIAEHGGTLEMINGFEPEGLYARIRGHFTWSVTAESAQQVRVCFMPVPGKAGQLDFGNNRCKGKAAPA